MTFFLRVRKKQKYCYRDGDISQLLISDLDFKNSPVVKRHIVNEIKYFVIRQEKEMPQLFVSDSENYMLLQEKMGHIPNKIGTESDSTDQKESYTSDKKVCNSDDQTVSDSNNKKVLKKSPKYKNKDYEEATLVFSTGRGSFCFELCELCGR